MSEKGWLHNNLANLLTLTRLSAPIVLFLTSWTIEEKLFGYLFLEATDIIDGIIARLTKTAGGIGKFLDPLVDKIMRGSGLIFLLISGLMDYWLAFPMILGEILIAIVFAYAIYLAAKREVKKNRLISPYRICQKLEPEVIENVFISSFGRMKAIAYGFGFGCLLLNIYHPHKITEMAYVSFFIAGFFLGAAAMKDYYRKFLDWQEKFFEAV